MAPFVICMDESQISVFSSITTGPQSKLSFGHVLVIIPIEAQIHYVQTLTEYP